MSNYVSSNTSYNKANKIIDIEDHNNRNHEPTYLLPEEFIQYKNQSHLFGGDSLGNYFQELKDLRIDNSKNKANIRKNENEVVESIIGLSEEQAFAYLNNDKDSLMKGLVQIAEDIKAKFGLEPLKIDLHVDEGHLENGKPIFNIHAHIVYYNFDFENNRSVLRTMLKSDFELMQDISANAMQKHGLDFIRGISKKETGIEHQERNDFIIDKQSKKIKELEQEKEHLFNVVSQGSLISSELDANIGSKVDEIKELDELIKESKLERKRVQEDTQLSKEEKKLVYKDITKMQEQHRNLRKHFVKEKKSYQTIKKDSLIEIKELIAASKKFGVIDEDKLAKSISNIEQNYIAKANSIKLGSENSRLKKEVDYYKSFDSSKLDRVLEENDSLSRVLKEKSIKINDLEKESKAKDLKIQSLENELNELNNEKKSIELNDFER